MTRIQIVIILDHLALVLMLPWLSGIGSDVVLTRQFPSIPRIVVLVIFIPKHQVVVY